MNVKRILEKPYQFQTFNPTLNLSTVVLKSVVHGPLGVPENFYRVHTVKTIFIITHYLPFSFFWCLHWCRYSGTESYWHLSFNQGSDATDYTSGHYILYFPALKGNKQSGISHLGLSCMRQQNLLISLNLDSWVLYFKKFCLVRMENMQKALCLPWLSWGTTLVWLVCVLN